MTAEGGPRPAQVAGEPATLGAFRLEAESRHQPALGTAYEAVDHSTRTAAHVTMVSAAGNPELAKRFLADVERLAQADHHGLPRVLDHGRTHDELWVATSPVTGTSLKELIGTGGALVPMRAVRLLGEVADALEAAHAQGLLHGELSAATVSVRELPVDRPLLWGFAFGRPADAAGTGYRSPEELRGEEPTPASDRYALACVLFEALAGRPPFRTGVPEPFRAFRGGPPRLSEHRPGLPVELDPILASGLADDPAARPATARDLLSETARVLVSGGAPDPAQEREEAEPESGESNALKAPSVPEPSKDGEQAAREAEQREGAGARRREAHAHRVRERAEEREAHEREAQSRGAREQEARARQAHEREAREREAKARLARELEVQERETRERRERRDPERADHRDRAAGVAAPGPSPATDHGPTGEPARDGAERVGVSRDSGRQTDGGARSWRSVRVAVAVTLVAAAGLAGFLAGRAGEDGNTASANVRASAGPLSLTVPASWERGEEPLPGGIALREPATARDGEARLAAGIVAPSGGVLFPRGTASKTIEEPGAPVVVKLGRLGAWRFRGAARSGGDRAVVFLSPTSAGMVGVSCTAPASASADFLPACERAAATLSMDADVRPVALASLSAYAARADRLLRRLASARRRDRRALRRAPLRRTQARVARRLVRSYRGAAEQLTRDVPRGARRQVRDLVGALRRGAAGYSALARATARTDRRRYRAASRAVRSAEGAAARAAARL